MDTHVHLDAAEFVGDRAEVYAAARHAGVSTLVVPSVDVASMEAVTQCCRDYPGCFPAYGIHPLYVGAADEADLEQVRQHLLAGRAVAVGEIGLDFFVPGFDEARQIRFFSAQLELARDLQLPVLLHVRRGIDRVLSQLRRIPVPGGIAHAFNGSRQQADAFLGLGFKLGFGGAMTYPRARRIRELAASLPRSAIVLETDAPDMAPEWARGERNVPAHLPRVASVLAELRGAPLDDIAVATRENALAALPRLKTCS